ncbi:flagellar assembly protein FliX [Sphingomonas sp. MMS24-J45]|uniref:flagellar assembly protein FliX n=1 Tax=Sphingomonas sp. MMS24-J45 TaxID=3238806 RepID=UPI0038518137
MRITANPALVATLLQTALPKAAGFAVAEKIAAPPAPATPVAQPVSVEMLVTLATAEPAIERRRRAAADAERGLRALESLDRALSAGLPPVERLEEVAAWAAEEHAPQEPELAALLKDIELRVRIELAKHEYIV